MLSDQSLLALLSGACVLSAHSLFHVSIFLLSFESQRFGLTHRNILSCCFVALLRGCLSAPKMYLYSNML